MLEKAYLFCATGTLLLNFIITSSVEKKAYCVVGLYILFCLTKFCLLHAIVKFSVWQFNWRHGDVSNENWVLHHYVCSWLKSDILKKPFTRRVGLYNGFFQKKPKPGGDMEWGPFEISRGIEEKVNGISRSQLKRKWNFQEF